MIAHPQIKWLVNTKKTDSDNSTGCVFKACNNEQRV